MSTPISEIGTARKPRLRDVLASIGRNPAFVRKDGQARVASGALFLGVLLSFGLSLAVFMPSVRAFGLYMALLATFHLLEFYLTAIFHPRTLSFTAFLLNHSFEYNVAVVASMVEFWLEWMVLPSKRYLGLVGLIGLLITVAGQAVRTLAMYTAGTNFTHLIAEFKFDSHQLVTDGVYAYCRHPAYAGWWWWCVGTQILLCNPVCLLGYAYVAWRFFDCRVRYEEERLFHFFGQQYVEYHRRVGTGIPFLSTPCLEQVAAAADAERERLQRERERRDAAKAQQQHHQQQQQQQQQQGDG